MQEEMEMRPKCRVLMRMVDGSHVGVNIPRVPRDVDSYLEQLRASRPEAALIMVTEDGVVKGRWRAV